jgi:hypothetical protein
MMRCAGGPIDGGCPDKSDDTGRSPNLDGDRRPGVVERDGRMGGGRGEAVKGAAETAITEWNAVTRDEGRTGK